MGLFAVRARPTALMEYLGQQWRDGVGGMMTDGRGRMALATAGSGSITLFPGSSSH